MNDEEIKKINFVKICYPASVSEALNRPVFNV